MQLALALVLVLVLVLWYIQVHVWHGRGFVQRPEHWAGRAAGVWVRPWPSLADPGSPHVDAPWPVYMCCQGAAHRDRQTSLARQPLSLQPCPPSPCSRQTQVPGRGHGLSPTTIA
jgi:hypothetical protein